jgi:asparagine synthase (glutamine-hydrolysing)
MRGIVPDEILDRKDKLAYAPPQHQWNHGALRGWIETMLQRSLKRTELFNCSAVKDVTERFAQGGDDTLAWRIASAEAWYETMIETPVAAGAGRAEISPISW